jgi:hypothetical protein
MGDVTGGCLCGAVRYMLKSAPTNVVVCHCTHCQKVSGSAFSTNALIAENALAIEGEWASFPDPSDSGAILNRCFCPRCGSSIFSRPANRPGVLILKVGTLDDHSSLQTAALQIWTRSRQPWVKFAADVPGFEKGRT